MYLDILIWEMKGLQSFPSLRGPFKDWAKLQFLHSEKYKAFFQFHLISYELRIRSGGGSAGSDWYP